MSTPRIRRRVSSAIAISSAHLHEHVLKFHKSGIDGSAKCDIVHTHNLNDIVYGVVFEMLAIEKPILDKYEGLGIGYEQKSIDVVQSDGKSIEAIAYYATRIDTTLKPYHWYKQHVLRGAREHALPLDHIQSIEATASTADPDQGNHLDELSIYYPEFIQQ
jgi:hypothetical protein